MGFLTRLLAGLVAASTLGVGLTGTAGTPATTSGDAKGVVTATADDTDGRVALDCKQSGEGATGPYADKFCWIDWSALPLDAGTPTPVRINVPGGHIDATAAVTHTDNAVLAAKEYTDGKWSRLTSAYRLAGDTALAFSGRMGKQDPAASVTFSDITPVADQTDTGVNVLKDFQLAFGDAEVMSGGILQGHDVYEQTDIESDKTLEKLGMIGSDDPGQSYSKANTGYGTTHVTLAGGPKGATDDANKDSKGSAVVGAKQASRFKVSFKQVNQHWDGWGSAIAVGVYMPYLTAYRLTYDKNASDATGQVPSNQRGRENTTQPAKAKTSGTVKTVADDTTNLPDHLVNGDFEYPAENVMTNSNQYWYISQNDDSYYTWDQTRRSKLPAGFDKTKFAWHSTQTGDTRLPDLERADDVQIDFKGDGGNHYSEISAAQSGATIYQDVATTPGVMYKWSLKHASLDSSHLDKMSVIIGEPGKETAQEATRTTVNGHGDTLGKVGTVISTKVNNPQKPSGADFPENAHTGQWETYTGTYIATSTVTRFAFRSIEGYSAWDGNLLDDISFSKAYKLTYDKNAQDATGQVPSNEYGKENTVKPAKAKTSGTVKTVADDTTNLPDHLVNGDFNVNYKDQWLTGGWNWTDITPDGKYLNSTHNWNDSDLLWKNIKGWNKSAFGWSSTQKDGTDNIQHKAGAVELQYDKDADNVYAELCAYEAGTAIYQDLKTVPGTLYKVRLKHASLDNTYVDKMQVLIGAPGHEQPVEMTRTSVNGHGDKLNEKSTTIATKVSNASGHGTNREHGSQWETYEGTYVIPAGQTVTRFTFESVDSKSLEFGNLLDDIVFDKAYRLSYDKNSSDASGSVPSDTTVNTVKPARTRSSGKSKTTGTVKTVADDTKSLPDHLVNGDFEYPSMKSLPYMFTTIDRARKQWIVNGQGSDLAKWEDIPGGLDESQFGWSSTQEQGATAEQRAGAVELQKASGDETQIGELCASQEGTAIYQDIATMPGTLYKVELDHASRYSRHLDQMQVMIGAPGHEQPVEMTRTVSNRYGDKVGEKSTTIATHSTTPFGQQSSTDEFCHYVGYYVIPKGQTVTRFTFKQISGVNSTSGNLLDNIVFTKAYNLSYDKNSDEATGSVPSDEYGRENTVKQAKAETTGSVRLAADRTDGKVSDLVRRTTTHADGSVTVKTVDQTTDVVAGCQVYYPAGQRITLATLAKDDDCWDSSMLSRPGHTQLGWNQDSQATQAQAEVTMVEGGMTVYAVWVGNPVLTYDTNKPGTWNGQMPSTPASVSVPYNTAAADGSGWASGDTSKIRGYKFLGWYAGPQDDAGLYDWNTPLTGNVTVYAHWQRLQAKVVYDRNASDAKGSHDPTTGWQYSDVTVPSDTSKSFTREGYKFLGWNTKADKTGTAYKDGSQVPLQDKDVTLYAIWQPVFEQFTPTGGVSLPLLVAGGVTLLVAGIGSTLMLTRRMRGEQ